MSLTLKEDSREFELLPEGVYVARCYKVVDGGTQEVSYAGETKLQRKVKIVWEILDKDTRMHDGRPFSISQQYTSSLNEKANLRKDLEAWRGKKFTEEEKKGFHLQNVLGTYCQIQVVHNEANGNTFANVNAIMSYKGDKPEPVNDTIMWDFDKHDKETYGKLTQREQEWLQRAQEWYDDIAEEGKLQANKEPLPEKPDDVEIEDIDEPINLDDIPF